MTYLNENIWIIQYVDTEILIELKNKNYYGFGSSEVDEEIRKELKKRKDELPYWELSPQLQSDSTPSVKESSSSEVRESSSESKTIEIGSNVKWTKNSKELTGIVEKITVKNYKICCKPGKQSGDTGPGILYMVPKEEVQLN